MEIYWSPKAEKQWRKIRERKIQGRILDAVESLKKWPHVNNVKTLINHNYTYRLRVGNWRVFFDTIEGISSIINIEEVKKRDERTY